jgi:hypothetical protein
MHLLLDLPLDPPSALIDVPFDRFLNEPGQPGGVDGRHLSYGQDAFTEFGRRPSPSTGRARP